MKQRFWVACVLFLATSVQAEQAKEAATPSVQPQTTNLHAQKPTPQNSAQQLDKILTSEDYSNKIIKKEWVPNEPLQNTPDSDWSWLGRILEKLAELGGVLGVVAKALALLFLVAMVYWLYVTRHVWLGWFEKMNVVKQDRSVKITPSSRSVKAWDKDLPPKQELMAFLNALLHRHQWLQALSVLYQATLRELGIQHHLPIDKHQTEDECLWLLARAQDASDKERWYFKELVGLWRASAYGKKLPKGVSNQDYSQIRALMQAWQLLYLKNDKGTF